MDNWPFTDPPNVAVLTTRSIVEGRAPITHVSHDADDGGWQFHDDTEAAIEADAMVVSLRSVVARDSSVAQLADLPEGWTASRSGLGHIWHRSRS